MKLDLDKFAIARERKLRRKGIENSERSGDLDFLISPIRRELEARVATSETDFATGLIVDFKESDFDSVRIDLTSCHSLLEPDSDPENSLKRYPQQKFDCVVINLQLAWLGFQDIVTQVERVLKPGGSFFFSSFGPDTLIELSQAWQKADTMPHVHEFPDLHHLGDELLQSGFGQPIVDVDWIFVNFPSVEILMRDLKAEGFTNLDSNRRQTLTGKKRFDTFKRLMKERGDEDDNCKITFEIVYGFARKPEQPTGSIFVKPPSIA